MSDPGFAEAIAGMDSMLFNSWYPIAFVLVFAVFYWCRSFMRGVQIVTKRQMNGKTVIVTGGNGGIGREIVLELSGRGARVIMACRKKSEGEDALQYVHSKCSFADVVIMELDLCSFKSIDKFVDDFLKSEERLDILVNNAGIILYPNKEKTEDDFEIHFQTNYLGHFRLTHKLLDLMKKSKPSRIINMAAVVYNLGKIDLNDINFDSQPEYTDSDAYARSKLAVMMFTRGLDKKLAGSGVTVNSVHPGVVLTEGHRNLGYYSNTFVRYSLYPIVWFLTKSPQDGAQTALHLAIAEEMEEVSGKYFVDCIETKTEANEFMDSEKMVDDLYKRSLKWCKL